MAATQGHARAQFNLGSMYSNGCGVGEDAQEALKWYNLAARQGIIEAQFNLGVLFCKGQGVRQDFIRAHMWFNVAAASGDEYAAKIRNELAKHMTPDQIAEAQRLAGEWKPQKGP